MPCYQEITTSVDFTLNPTQRRFLIIAASKLGYKLTTVGQNIDVTTPHGEILLDGQQAHFTTSSNYIKDKIQEDLNKLKQTIPALAIHQQFTQMGYQVKQVTNLT